MSQHSKHGGVREGAGRKAKALRYAHEVAAQEAKIVAALPEMIDLLLAAARKGDTSATRYLVDRVLGRVQTQAKPVAEDYTLPYDHPGAGEVAEVRRRREMGKALSRPESLRDDAQRAEHAVTEAEVYAELGTIPAESAQALEDAKVPPVENASPSSRPTSAAHHVRAA